MNDRVTERMALERVTEILGSVQGLSERLGIPVAEVERWIGGEEPLPLGVFSALMNVLFEHSRQDP